MASAIEKVEDVKVTERIVQEGKATVFLPSTVFYNPVQEFNRDLSIAVISLHAKEHLSSVQVSSKKKPNDDDSMSLAENSLESSVSGIKEDVKETERLNALEPKVIYENGVRILEALAATGLRSVRFALEIPGVKEIIANDFDQNAVEYIRKNATSNQVGNLVKPSFSDASLLMYQSRRTSDRFNVIDLDPYGSPAIFLDSALQSVADGGLLCVTCTDMAVLCGNATETCHAKYGSTSLKAKFCHEMALRILLRSIESHANRYSRYIAPLLSVSVDFYCRVFVRVFTGQSKVKDSASKLSMVYCCNSCGAFELQPLCVKIPTKNDHFKYAVSTGLPVESSCKHCNGRHNLGGPIWSAPIHDVDFISRLIQDLEKDPSRFGTNQRMLGVLSVVAEELQDQPLYYDSEHLSSVLHCTAVGFLPMRSALLNAGYRVSLSHANKTSLKTNAPAQVLWDILRCWVKTNPVKIERLQPGSAAHVILSKEPTFEADFTIHPDANPQSRKKGLVRWQLNPERDWGPKPRAGRNQGSLVERRATGEMKRNERNAKRKSGQDASPDTKKYICKRFKKGLCELGDKCVYSHSEDVCQNLQQELKLGD